MLREVEEDADDPDEERLLAPSLEGLSWEMRTGLAKGKG